MKSVTNDRNHALDLLRGVCAVSVTAYHYAGWNYSIWIESVGAFGVYMFFTLSSITMMMVYGERFGSSITVDPLRAFYLNRVARLIPLLTLVALFFLAYNAWQGSPFADNWARAFLTATGLFGLSAPGFLSSATGAWSLGIEFAFYLVFPLIALAANAAKNRALVVTLLVLVLAQQAALSVITLEELWWPLYATPLTFAPFFAAGILAARDQSSPKLWRLAFAGALLLVVFSFSMVTDVHIYRDRLAHTALMAISCLAVWAAYRAKVPAFMVPIGIFLGEISYALYLTHWISDYFAGKIVSRLGLSADLKVWIFLFGAPTAAYVVFRLFEMPANMAIRRALSSAPRHRAD